MKNWSGFVLLRKIFPCVLEIQIYSNLFFLHPMNCIPHFACLIVRFIMRFSLCVSHCACFIVRFIMRFSLCVPHCASHCACLSVLDLSCQRSCYICCCLSPSRPFNKQKENSSDIIAMDASLWHDCRLCCGDLFDRANWVMM